VAAKALTAGYEDVFYEFWHANGLATTKKAALGGPPTI